MNPRGGGFSITCNLMPSSLVFRRPLMLEEKSDLMAVEVMWLLSPNRCSLGRALSEVRGT